LFLIFPWAKTKHTGSSLNQSKNYNQSNNSIVNNMLIAIGANRWGLGGGMSQVSNTLQSPPCPRVKLSVVARGNNILAYNLLYSNNAFDYYLLQFRG